MGILKERYIAKQRDISQVSATPPFPRIVKIDICNTCNYACVFCPQAKQINKIGSIDKELCLRLICDAYAGGGRELCLSSTGEPLVNPNLEEYILYAKKMGYEYVFFNTNGYLLNEKRASTILSAGVDSIKFSINANSSHYKLIHGVDGYDVVVNNLKNLFMLREKMDIKCKLFVSFIATPYTQKDVEEIRNEIGAYVDEILVMNANNRGGSANEVEKYLYNGQDDFAYQFPCSQLFNNLYITAEGYLVICCQDFENMGIVADLNEERVEEAWNNPKFVEFRRRYLAGDLKGTLCDNCLHNTHERVVPLTPEKAGYRKSTKRESDLQKRICTLIKTEGKKDE